MVVLSHKDFSSIDNETSFHQILELFKDQNIKKKKQRSHRQNFDEEE